MTKRKDPKDLLQRGAPTKYREEMNDLVDVYLKECQDELINYQKSISEGAQSTSSSQEQKVIVKLPTKEGFALFLDVGISSLELWAKKYPEFSRSLNKLHLTQGQRLISGGLSGLYSVAITKLMMMSNHGFKEKQDIDHTTLGEQITGMVIK